MQDSGPVSERAPQRGSSDPYVQRSRVQGSGFRV